MIFTTKGNNLSVFGKSVYDLKTRFYELFNVFKQYGLKGENGMLSALFNRQTTTLTPELKNEFELFANEFNNSSKSVDVLKEKFVALSEKVQQLENLLKTEGIL